MKQRLVLRQGLWTATVIVSLVSFIHAHEGHTGGAFHAHDWNQALRLSAQQQRLILAWSQSEDSSRFGYLRRLSDEVLLNQIRYEFVLFEHEFGSGPAPFTPDSGPVPQIHVFDEKGNRIASLPQSLSSQGIIKSLRRSAYRSGRAQKAIDWARQSLDRSVEPTESFFARERLAALLGFSGEHEEARKLLRSCLDEAMQEKSTFATSRRRGLLLQLAELTSLDSSYQELVESMRKQGQERLLTESGGVWLASELGELYQRLGKNEWSLELFSALGSGNMARRGLFDQVFPALMAQGRYLEILEWIQPEASFRGELGHYQKRRITSPSSAEKGTGRGSRAFFLSRTGGLIESLAAVGRSEDAKKLIDSLRKALPDPDVVERLRVHLGRAQNREVMAHLEASLKNSTKGRDR